MSFQRKLIVVALASVMPMVSVHAQSVADLQKEIAALRAQLQSLQSKVEAIGSAPAASPQQVNRLEQKIELMEEEADLAGFKGMKFKGAMEAAYIYDNMSNDNKFDARDGNAGTAMFEITKETDGSDGIGWTLRLTPGGASLVHEATVQVPVSEGHRIIAGLIPDYQGYEATWTHQNPLVTHNALFDVLGPSSYTGFGMSNQLGSDLAVKWMVGNIDYANDDGNITFGKTNRSVGAAYRFDWTLSEYAFLGLSGAHASNNREFNVMAIDGGYTRGDWLFNGHLNWGTLENGAENGQQAKWYGVSGLMGYKLTPRLQLLARADYVGNRDNGGGTYFTSGPGGTGFGTSSSIGLGPELDSGGNIILDANGNSVGANLTRISLGTNYLINPSTNWKFEVRQDRSSGNNFVDSNGVFGSTKTTIGTALVVHFGAL